MAEITPYVGPKPIDAQHRLYGRKREVVALAHLLFSERLVLLHSPSGAGKTSLIDAREGLRDRVKTKLLPLSSVRVYHRESVAVADKHGLNPYLLSVLSGLERDAPAARSIEDLATWAKQQPPGESLLDAYLNLAYPTASSTDKKRPLLIFDQFEELLTLNPVDTANKREFLRDIGTALAREDRWALFAIREDYLGALDPYLPLLPTRLSATFRLNLLDRAGAEEAIRGPAEENRAQFEPDAIEHLLKQLALTFAMDAEGKPQPRDGETIEPVFLQVVCQQAWKRRKTENAITLADLQELKPAAGSTVDGVVAALMRYYDDGVDQVKGPNATARAVRNFFGRALLSDRGFRLPVLLGQEQAFGLNAKVLDELTKIYLIRRDTRHAGTWFELAHDRLIEPVRLSNQAWRQSQNAFHRQADLYREAPESQKADMLVRGEVLALGESLKAEEDARIAADPTVQREFTADDLALLTASQERAKLGRYRRWGIAAVVLVAGLLGLVTIYIQRDFKRKAEDNAKGFETQASTANIAAERAKEAKEVADKLAEAKAREKELTKAKNAEDEALRLQFDDPKQSALLGWEAIRIYETNNIADQIPNELTASLKRAVTSLGLSLVGKQAASIQNVVFVGPKRDWVLTRAADDRVDLWKIPEPHNPNKKAFEVRCSKMAVLHEGNWLAAGLVDGSIKLWDLRNPAAPKSSLLRGPSTPVTAMAVGGNRLLAVGFASGKIATYDLAKPDDKIPPPIEWQASITQERAISSLIFSPWPIRLLSDSQDGLIRSWGVSGDGKTLRPPVQNLDYPIKPIVSRMAMNTQATALAVGTVGYGVLFFSMTPETKGFDPKRPISIRNGTAEIGAGTVTSLAFSGEMARDREGERLGYYVVATTSNLIANVFLLRREVADAPFDAFLYTPLLVGEKGNAQPRFTATAFNEGPTKLLIAGAADGSAYVWDATAEGLKSKKPLALTGPNSSITVVAIQPGSDVAFTGAADGSIRRWDLKSFRKNRDTNLTATLKDLDPKQLAVTSKGILDGHAKDY